MQTTCFHYHFTWAIIHHCFFHTLPHIHPIHDDAVLLSNHLQDFAFLAALGALNHTNEITSYDVPMSSLMHWFVFAARSLLKLLQQRSAPASGAQITHRNLELRLNMDTDK